MSAAHIPPPRPGEYDAFYAGYIAALGTADALVVLRRQPQQLRALCGTLSDAEALARYAPGKWSVKEVVGHITDAERIFAYRALRIARRDATPLSGFEENRYVAAAGFDRRTLPDLLADFEVARSGTLSLVRGIDPGAWENRGVANHAEVTLRAMVHIIAGHVQHHLRILRERYGLRGPEAEIPMP